MGIYLSLAGFSRARIIGHASAGRIDEPDQSGSLGYSRAVFAGFAKLPRCASRATRNMTADRDG
jgi:hypothetical protein